MFKPKWDYDFDEEDEDSSKGKLLDFSSDVPVGLGHSRVNKGGTLDHTFTGYFRDGEKRIDYILVLRDTSNNTIVELRVNYLINLLNLGLVLEIEPGRRERHTDLLFIKIHAPDNIILKFGGYFDVFKPFKNSHVEYIKPDPHVLDKFMPCQKLSYEREWIKFVRAQYPGPSNYSTIERSEVVYRIMQATYFGPPENFFGLDTLLENNVIQDAYPLHDGPYFYLPEQDHSVVNGRQILTYIWPGYENLFKSQPVHMIREYCGERVAFFFGFYQYYNRTLLYLALIGLLTFVFSVNDFTNDKLNQAACTKYSYVFSKWYTTHRLFYYTRTVELVYRWQKGYINFWPPYWVPDQKLHAIYRNANETFTRSTVDNKLVTFWEYSFWTDHVGTRVHNKYDEVYSTRNVTRVFMEVYYEDMPVCPKCRDFYTCPFRNMTEYCTEARIKNWIDNPFAVYYSLAACIWGNLIYLFWRRKEKFYEWMWEVSEEGAINLVRFKYKTIHKASILTGMMAVKDFLQHLAMRLSLISAVVILYIFGVIPALVWMKYFMLKVSLPFDLDWGFHQRTYFILILLSIINATVIHYTDKAVEELAHKFADYLNHRTEDMHEKSLVVKMHGFSFMSNFSLLLFFGVIKGQIYTFPSDENRWFMPLGIGVMNCGIISCIDELFVMYIATGVSKIIVEFISENYRLIFKKKIHLTDYIESKKINRSIPCWEKEYRLTPIDDRYLMKRYDELFLQMEYLLLFSFVFPLAPLIVCIANRWFMKKLAFYVLLCGRRPTMAKKWGLGAWSMVFISIPVIAGVVNGLVVVLNSSVIDRTIYEQYFNGSRYFADYAMSMFNTTDYFLVTGRYSPNETFEELYNSNVWRADFCLFPGKWNRRAVSYKFNIGLDNSYTPTSIKWLVNWYQACYFLIFIKVVGIFGLLLHASTKQTPTDIEETKFIENILKAHSDSSQEKEEE